MKTDTLIFDIGSVLVYLDFPEALKQMGLSGRARKKILEVPPIPGFWEALDRGDISRDEGARWFASYVPGRGICHPPYDGICKSHRPECEIPAAGKGGGLPGVLSLEFSKGELGDSLGAAGRLFFGV